jgi:hypothetical protein
MMKKPLIFGSPRLPPALIAATLLFWGAPPLHGQGDPAGPSGELEAVQAAMASAATHFLESLDPGRRSRASLPFDDSLRMGWAYIPGARPGLLLADMTGEQRRRAHALLRTALSGPGYLKVTSIMQLEEVLRGIETDGFPRNVEGYVFAIFGDPAGDRPWGWRFEGHHVSLNFTSVRPEALATTPLFLGSNPAEVRVGSWAGLRVLAEEEDLARALLLSLTPQQRGRAIFSERAPPDIVTRNDPVARDVPMEGLPVREMTTDQRLLLLRLLEVYASTLQTDVAQRRLGAIREAGVENLHFAWAGGSEVGGPHYYRIQGPTLLIEYDNVQSGANHIHTVWRDLEDDFGGDMLRRHYETSPHHRH